MALIELFKPTNLKNSHTLITGPDAYLNDYVAKDFIRQEKFKNLEQTIIDCSEDGIEELIANLTESSLFAQQKLIVVKNPFFLTARIADKYKKQVNKLQLILDHLQEIENILVIIASYEKIDKRKKISKILFDQVDVVETKYRPYEISGLIKGISKSEGYTITNQALQLLIQRSDQVLDTALNNYVKLKSISEDQKIRESLIEQNVDRSLSENIFEILTVAFKGDYAQASARLDEHLREGNNAIQILGIFESQIEFLMVVKTLQTRRWTREQIIKELKANPYRIKLAMQNVVTLEKLKYLLQKCIALDFGYKNGQYRGNEYLKMFILSL
ncbi:DNA polymerase III subunit delta [Lactobacillus sp. PV034]|uniref:DNA polymerase III subunit delta n=1 Tax=Lactobacillus sp. PV034 TaxID=2594495 RepID=UPI00223EBB2D|nr:DNA polymerase III subunit delta [Lactobacillus sp. PV034]QNQ80579.1 DNA polymerase III subunit delta [Lactobacillus sp. PV034]